MHGDEEHSDIQHCLVPRVAVSAPSPSYTVCVNASSEKGKQVLGVITVQAVWSQGHLAGVAERTPRTLVQGAFSWGQRAESSHGPTRAQ